MKFWLCLSADDKVLGYSSIRGSALVRRVVGVICQARVVGWIFKIKPTSLSLGVFPPVHKVTDLKCYLKFDSITALSSVFLKVLENSLFLITFVCFS